MGSIDGIHGNSVNLEEDHVYVYRGYDDFELITDTLEITQNGNNIDVSQYAAVNVNVSSGPALAAEKLY
jgi:hypothetical protein